MLIENTQNQIRSIYYTDAFMNMEVGTLHLPEDWTCIESKIIGKFSNVLEKAHPFHISSFEQIGMHDPYPQEPKDIDEFVVPLTEEDLAYPKSAYK